MEATKRGNSEETGTAAQSLGAGAHRSDEVFERSLDEPGEGSGDLYAKLQAAIDKAKEVYERLEDRSVAAAKATDKAVRRHPYETIGLAFGVGLLVGVLSMRRRRD